MKILVINSGSSSLKFQLLEKGKKFRVLCKGIVDGIGLKTCQFRMENGKINISKNLKCNDHHDALEIVLKGMLKEKIIPSLDVIGAIGHRVVHGGEKYQQAVRINKQVMKTIRELSELAPLHNPPNLKGIEACQKQLEGVPQVAVFDTAFHNTIPEKAYLYALPYELYTKDGIRRYGFHGTSHQYVSEMAIKILKKKKSRARGSATAGAYKKLVNCHLGNGSSVTAIVNGKSVDTSMGLTPLEGVPMGTRSGDIDSAIIFHLLKQHHMSADNIEKMLIKESGLKGISGISSDVRDLWAAVKKPSARREAKGAPRGGAGDTALRDAETYKKSRAELTFKILSYRLAKYIGSYAAAMNGLDAIIFTAGIGEHAYYIRRDVCAYLEHLGVRLDPKKNRKDSLIISNNKSKIKVLVIPTNEEEQIAKETLKILAKK